MILLEIEYMHNKKKWSECLKIEHMVIFRINKFVVLSLSTYAYDLEIEKN